MKTYIYALINPSDQQVFYVGASISPKDRYSHHIYNAKKTSKNPKSKLILDIQAQGLQPEICVLDCVEFNEGTFFENHYMDLFRSFGFNLRQKRRSLYNESEAAEKTRWEAPHKSTSGMNTSDVLTKIFYKFRWYAVKGLELTSYEGDRLKKKYYEDGLRDEVIAQIMKAHGYELAQPKKHAVFRYNGDDPKILAMLGPDRLMVYESKVEGGEYPTKDKMIDGRGRPRKNKEVN